jgi:GAF domain-containing protein/multidrug efflux pump subunit AcrA (membrane-fusion protein)
MTTQDPTAVALRLAAELVRARDERQAAAATARAAGLIIGADSVRVWLLDRSRGYRFVGVWPETEGAPPDEPSTEVARVVAFGVPTATEAAPPFRSRLTLPLMAGLRPLGAVELLERERAGGAFDKSDAEPLQGLIRAADEALVAVRAAAAREHGSLEALTRLTRLFDVGRSIAGVLDAERLHKVIVNRVLTTVEVEGAYLWLLDESGEAKVEVQCAAGAASDEVLEWKLEAGEGVAGTVLETQESLLVDEEDDLLELGWRPDSEAGLAIDSIGAVPIIAPDDRFLGVIEAINKEDDALLTKADIGMLREIADSAAIALVNIHRLDAERRASDLGRLLDVAREVGSHLAVQKVSFTLVHQLASVVRYSRASVGLLRGTRLELVAVSGQTFVDESLPEMKALADVLGWAAGLDDGLYVVQNEDGSIDTDRPETREKFKSFFEKTGSRSFLVVPMHDDEGRLGAFSLEADVPYAFSERDLEATTLLALQATVAVRNAALYERIPMARVFKPLARQTESWAGKPWLSRLSKLGAAALIAAVLVVLPAPLRVGGRARVLPENRSPVTAEIEGRVARVLVNEGDRIETGQLLAIMDGNELLAGREQVESRYQIAVRERDRFLAEGDAAEAAVERAKLDGLRAELDLWESRIEDTHLRSPVGGLIATPRIDELQGAKLARGEIFCEIVDAAPHLVEVSVAEADAGLLEVGMPAKVKLYAYPTRSFRGTVKRIGVTAALQDDQRVFTVLVDLGEPEAVLRTGMTGQAKIDTGRTSLARVMLRRPARWLWGVVWGWLP